MLMALLSSSPPRFPLHIGNKGLQKALFSLRSLFLKTLAVLAVMYEYASYLQPSIHSVHWLTADDFAQEWHLDLPRGGGLRLRLLTAVPSVPIIPHYSLNSVMKALE